MAQKIFCELEKHNGQWIEVTDSITIKTWNRWRHAEADETQAMLQELILDWNLTDKSGKNAPPPKDPVALDNLELFLLPWLVSAVSEVFKTAMEMSPQAPSPSPTT